MATKKTNHPTAPGWLLPNKVRNSQTTSLLVSRGACVWLVLHPPPQGQMREIASMSPTVIKLTELLARDPRTAHPTTTTRAMHNKNLLPCAIVSLHKCIQMQCYYCMLFTVQVEDQFWNRSAQSLQRQFIILHVYILSIWHMVCTCMHRKLCNRLLSFLEATRTADSAKWIRSKRSTSRKKRQKRSQSWSVSEATKLEPS